VDEDDEEEEDEDDPEVDEQVVQGGPVLTVVEQLELELVLVLVESISAQGRYKT
jgi:hypothetical protein